MAPVTRDPMTITKLALTSVCTVGTMLMIGGCGNNSETEPVANIDENIAMTVPQVSFKPGSDEMTTSTLGGPVRISYRIIGTPVVGQPIAIDLRFASAIGTQAFAVSYRVNDATAMRLPESQAQTISISPTSGDEESAQQVTVVPMREGRLYLNVAATIETDTGSMSSVTAIPIQVGPAAPRELLENGERGTDENGEAIISLPAREE